MTLFQKLGTLMMLLILVSISSGQSSSDLNNCEIIVKKWAESSKDNAIKEDKLSLKDLLFFLHVPRTGGRTYFHCFLKKLYTVDQECPRSYDRLHFNPRKPNCRLMATHDDYSLMSKLPVNRTSVITILRNPIDRVFSTYEFAMEVAARFLVHPNLTSATETSRRVRPGVSTLDIWPWKYLVPWMRADLFSRRDVRKYVKHRLAKDVGGNPYDMEDMVMPLHEFMNDPIAHDIIHNGATFQVAGITNNSISEESHKVRLCVNEHPALGQYVLEVAKSRLDNMLYVGFTEDHEESATMFANLVGALVLSQSETLKHHLEQKNISKNETEMRSSDGTAALPNQVKDTTKSQQVGNVQSSSDGVPENRSMTVEELMKGYEGCTSSLRRAHATRRSLAFKKVAPANFSKEARLSVPVKLLQEILTLNSLDVELYRHAQGIFLRQKHLMQKDQVISNRQDIQVLSGTGKEGLQVDLHGDANWNAVCTIICACFIVTVVLLIVTVKKRSSKLKI